MRGRLRTCATCGRGVTMRRLERAPWLFVVAPDGGAFMYCGGCGPDALDEWAPEAIEAARAGHAVRLSLIRPDPEQGVASMQLDLAGPRSEIERAAAYGVDLLELDV